MFDRSDETQVFAFFVEGIPDEECVSQVRARVERLAREHHWAYGAPQFVDEVDAESCTRPEDVPVRSVGGFLEQSIEPVDASQRRDLEYCSIQLAERKLIIAVACELSHQLACDFEIYFGGEVVGWVSRGEPDLGVLPLIT